ncbi:MAG: hypothetical protein DI625_17535 [Sphingomonas sp.]|nr:MAG: hypothetical protein DI625_17535 [Sphingomonas sp.]
MACVSGGRLIHWWWRSCRWVTCFG